MFSMIFPILYPLIISLNYIVIVINVSFFKLSKKSICMISLIDYIVTFILITYRKDEFSVPIVTLIIIIYLYYFSKKIYFSIVIAIFTNITFAISDAIVGFLYINIFNIEYAEVVANNSIYLAIGVSILFVSFLISKFIQMISRVLSFKEYILDKFLINNKLVILFIILGIIEVYSSIMLQKIYFRETNKVVILINLVLTIIYFVTLILTAYTINKNIISSLQKEYNEKEYQQLNDYTNSIEVILNDFRGFRHDYINIIKTLESYIDAEDILGLKQLFEKELLFESNKIIGNVNNIELLQYIKINAVKALISSKIIKAQSYNIETNLEITDEINFLQVGIVDICRIIGIILDNAIEATIICDKKRINIGIIKNEDSTVFFISNSCSKDTPPVHKLYEKGFSTKGYNRGIGLKTVRQIIDTKYDNILLDTKIKDCIFSQELIIHE